MKKIFRVFIVLIFFVLILVVSCTAMMNKEMEKTKAILNQIIAEQTGKSVEQVTNDTERDYWLDSKEAVEYGLVSRIVTKREDLEK